MQDWAQHDRHMNSGGTWGREKIRRVYHKSTIMMLFIVVSTLNLLSTLAIATPGIHYSPLHTARRSIRTLQLLPGRWLDPISCTIHPVFLDDKPTYDALSYVWGNASDTLSIQVNSSPFHATKNLVAALRRLRSSVETRTLWVDAICIDQADNHEKMEQVKMMADIYKSATSVRVFLGESGVLDHASQAEQESWDDAPRFEWQRDYVFLVHTGAPRNKMAVRD
jgi:hypothetical protein